MALASEGRDQHHLIAALPTDYGTGYAVATGVMSALRQRQEQGGFWSVEATLCSTIMLALSLPPEKEDAVPVTDEDMVKYCVDQESNFGAVFTRLASGAQLSVTPSYCATGPSVIGACDPFKTGWDKPDAYAQKGSPAHRPSIYAKEGLTGEIGRAHV